MEIGYPYRVREIQYESSVAHETSKGFLFSTNEEFSFIDYSIAYLKQILWTTTGWGSCAWKASASELVKGYWNLLA